MRNYSSTVPAERSITNIERRLVRAGASNIVKTYDGGTLSGLFFTIRSNGKEIPFKMPARIDRVHDHLVNGIKRPRKETLRRLKEQAERTAWKLLHEWVDIQLTIVDLGQADLAEIFLPYVYDHRRKETLYERILSGELKLLE